MKPHPYVLVLVAEFALWRANSHSLIQKTEKAMPLLRRFAQSFGSTPSLPWYGALQPDLLVMQLQGFIYPIDATASYVLVAELELWRANNRSFMPRRVRKGCSSPWRNICNIYIYICIYVKAFWFSRLV